MQEDFHYYATYCAACLAGYSHEESETISYFAQFVDCCSKTLLEKVKGPQSAATTQLRAELVSARTDLAGLQNITRIWASFHFLPYDLYVDPPKRPRSYRNKYRLICKPNGELVADTVRLAKGSSLQAVGVAMHVLADTWAHSFFAGTPSLVINNTDSYFYELLEEDGQETERQIRLHHNPTVPDDIEKGYYTGSPYQSNERSIMNLGHGRAGHLPDYSFACYKYLPAWGDYQVIVKDNPSDYYHAFCQMVYAMKYIRGDKAVFQTECYDEDEILPWKEEIDTIIRKRQLDAGADWREFGRKLSGQLPAEFDIARYQEEYMGVEKKKKDDTPLGLFFLAAMAQKSMVTNKIFKSGNMLAGFSVDYSSAGFKGIKDFRRLIDLRGGDRGNE